MPIAVPAPDRSAALRGTALAALGVTAFSLTFPGTAWALEGLGPWSVTAHRVSLAGLLALGCLLGLRVPLPPRRRWRPLVVVAAGVVVGFPLLTTLALQTSTTSHAAVVVGLLPLTTAAYGAWRYRTRHSRSFWTAAVTGALVVVAFALQQSGGALAAGDLFLFAALLVCAAGYAEGGRLARELPGWQVIGWALVLCLPLAVPGALLALAAEPVNLTARSLIGLGWLAVGSQFLGLVVWYRGMGTIGVGRASQLQLAQPLLTLLWAVLLVAERPSPLAPVTAVAVLACIAVTQRATSSLPAPDKWASPATGRRLASTRCTPLGDRRTLQMQAEKGDKLLVHGRIVGQHDRTVEIVEVLGEDGQPPYRVRAEDGHESVMSPGPDSVVRHLPEPRQ